MLFLTKLFGVTETDAERSLADEKTIVEQIVEKVLLMQAQCAAAQKLPLRRGTHAKGTAVRGQFEVLDVTAGRDAALAQHDFGFAEVSLGFSECALALHHSGSGTLPECFYECRGNFRHIS